MLIFHFIEAHIWHRERWRGVKKNYPQDAFSDKNTLESKYTKDCVVGVGVERTVCLKYQRIPADDKIFQWIIIIMGWCCNGHWLFKSYVKNTSKSSIIGLSEAWSSPYNTEAVLLVHDAKK